MGDLPRPDENSTPSASSLCGLLRNSQPTPNATVRDRCYQLTQQGRPCSEARQALGGHIAGATPFMPAAATNVRPVQPTKHCMLQQSCSALPRPPPTHLSHGPGDLRLPALMMRASPSKGTFRADRLTRSGLGWCQQSTQHSSAPGEDQAAVRKLALRRGWVCYTVQTARITVGASAQALLNKSCAGAVASAGALFISPVPSLPFTQCLSQIRSKIPNPC